MMMVACIVFSLFVAVVSASSPSPGFSSMIVSEQQVTDKFFKPYGSYQRPRLNASQPVVVNLTLVMSGISDVFERQRLIQISGYVQLRWIDEFRAWKNEAPYNSIDYIVVPGEKIWLPDVAQMNADGRYRLMAMAKERARIYNNGLVFYSPGGTFSASCEFDLRLFPFDTQTCAIALESWQTTRKYMRFRFGSNITIKYWTENEQWQLIKTEQSMRSLSYLNPENAFDHADFHITIKRKVMYYMMNVLFPSILIGLTHLTTFLLPTGVIERVNISFTCLLAYSVFQVMIQGEMPRSSDRIPLLTLHLDLQMAYIALSILGEGLSLHFLELANRHDYHCHRAPTVSRWLLNTYQIIGVIICIGKPPRLEVPVRRLTKSGSGATDQFKTAENASVASNARGSSSDNTGDDDRRPSLMARHEMDAAILAQRHGYLVCHNTQCKCTTADIAHRQWTYLSVVTDRLLGILYLLSIVLTPTVIFGIMPYL